MVRSWHGAAQMQAWEAHAASWESVAAAISDRMRARSYGVGLRQIRRVIGELVKGPVGLSLQDWRISMMRDSTAESNQRLVEMDERGMEMEAFVQHLKVKNAHYQDALETSESQLRQASEELAVASRCMDAIETRPRQGQIVMQMVKWCVQGIRSGEMAARLRRSVVEWSCSARRTARRRRLVKSRHDAKQATLLNQKIVQCKRVAVLLLREARRGAAQAQVPFWPGPSSDGVFKPI